MVEARADGVERPEGLHADVVAYRVMPGATDEDRDAVGHRQVYSDDVMVIGRGIVGVVPHMPGRVDGRDL